MNRSDFIEGIRGGTPVCISAAPFGALFGAVAVANGQTISEAALMSMTIFAGASQLVGIELFGHNVQPWIIVLSIFAVNFRHILYSAAIAPHLHHFSILQKCMAFFLLTDPQFAESVRRGEKGKGVSFAWYMGFGLVIYLPWQVMTVLGGIFGRLIGDPKVIGIDVLLPIYFMALVLGFRSRPNFLPVVAVSGAASVIAYHTVGSPWHVSIGAVAGMLLAAILPTKGEPKHRNAQQGV
ncbi:AzlC family ABC transporter permease [Rhizobiaceae bacterium n13]|uniref:AzlC family ABC transporter permease n=1 Tax=Ferirhizobium litorale TaxID=2927786 RepID=A0AAE3U5I4_9HYPH|nr:AzlC family ABC transporter permease [Fererhizobium litorale]MDI7863811.1 AzlC family ABC transporter permease [Fererhizobium litorale]MDI7924089.1 AzlC family ABC transporter permease [Fererhizobium litorale]